MNYNELIHNENISKALKTQNITTPTEIQQQVFEPLISGRDVIAHSQTGSGKTLAYLVPAFLMINPQQRSNQVVILVPTYELAIQVQKQAALLADNMGSSIRALAIIGNGNISRQIAALKEKPEIIVGTAGRILELIQKKKISAHTVRLFVIDESDKLLDHNNLESVLAVRKTMLRDTQTALFSASLNNKTLEESKKITHEAQLIQITAKNHIPDNIEHIYIMVPSKRDKLNTLRSICSALQTKRAMIFINTQYDIDQAYERLTYHHYKVARLCSSIDKMERKNSINGFRSGRLNYLIATDIASRGLHVDGIETVINVTIPEKSTDYLHRAGRCGRNLKKGQCISIITPSEMQRIKIYQSDFKISFIEKKLEKGHLN